MSITFLSVPTGVKVPGIFTEFDTSKAIQGLSIQNRRVLLIGQKLSTGSKAAGSIDLVTSQSQARDFYGKGSMLFHMAKAFIGENGGLNELNMISLDDAPGVKATGSYEILTAPTADGTLSLMIGGTRYRVTVLDADTEEDIIDKLVVVITADEDRHVDVVKNGGNLDLLDITYRHGGEVGNDIDIRENFFEGEVLPKGITSTIAAMSGGSANPTISSIITAMGEKQFHDIVMAYSDGANLGLMQTELVDRWGPIRQNDGQLYFARKESFSDHSTFLDTRNNEQETVMNIAGPTPQFEWASNIAALIAKSAQADPALPFESLALSQVLAPKDSELFDFGERDQLLKAGSSTFEVDTGGTVRLERMRTTRIENEFAAPDEALADLNPKLTLAFLRFDFNANWVRKFSRHKLADDGTKFGPGQRIMTPKIAKGEAISRFRIWETQGLVENFEQFKRDLIVERDITDRTRINILLPPDLINQLRIAGVQIAFIL